MCLISKLKYVKSRNLNNCNIVKYVGTHENSY